MHKHIYPCGLCKKKIIVTEEYRRGGGSESKAFNINTSLEGVYWEESNRWFCNECWAKILKKENKLNPNLIK